uniref:Nucleolar protein 5A n=1 Tax=Otolemur garnettii TaxID=30611 RepID=H0XT67_OTOGA
SLCFHKRFEVVATIIIFVSKKLLSLYTQAPTAGECGLNLGKCHNIVHLVAFSSVPWPHPFALENVNVGSEGIVHEDLHVLLETHLPSRKKKLLLGDGDFKIDAMTQEGVGYNCQIGGPVAKILCLQGSSREGHRYPHAEGKLNVNWMDNIIIQSISLQLWEQMNKDINTFSVHVREWHSLGLIEIISDDTTPCYLSQFIVNGRPLNEGNSEKLKELKMDGTKTKAILDAHSSMGTDTSAIDLINIKSFSHRVVSLSEHRAILLSKMSQVAPLSALTGEVVGSGLITHTDCLSSLTKYPASTVQILGEKAPLRAWKTRSNTPHQLIFHSSFTPWAAAKKQGCISQYQQTIASRINCFSDVPMSVFGRSFEQDEEQLFYETEDIPQENVMKEAVVQMKEVAARVLENGEEEKKCLKKKSSRTLEGCKEMAEKPKKKKKQNSQELSQE